MFTIKFGLITGRIIIFLAVSHSLGEGLRMDV